jgi:mannitol-1-phosphate 5-dehydrogenase
MQFAREAFLEESGAALCRKYGGVDPLFTTAGFRLYAEDLLVRMLNPHLRDAVERVTRDPQRKLGWNDRLVGTMRLVMAQGLTPTRFARGARDALAALDANITDDGVATTLTTIWGHEAAEDPQREEVIQLIKEVHSEN